MTEVVPASRPKSHVQQDVALPLHTLCWGSGQIFHCSDAVKASSIYSISDRAFTGSREHHPYLEWQSGPVQRGKCAETIPFRHADEFDLRLGRGSLDLTKCQNRSLGFLQVAEGDWTVRRIQISKWRSRGLIRILGGGVVHDSQHDLFAPFICTSRHCPFAAGTSTRRRLRAHVDSVVAF